MQKIKLKNLFTMVELILVIAIIAFLTVTATVVLSQWLSKSRDSRRMADIAQIEKGIETAFIENNEYPLPDNYVNITASGTLFNYQGKFCDTATEKSNIKATPKDPSDNACYTYETTTGKNNFQLMAFMENTDAKIGFNENAILAVDYTKRIPATKGAKLGILVASGTNQPIEDSGTGVDIVNTISEFVSHFDNNKKIQGTGKQLIYGSYLSSNNDTFKKNIIKFDNNLIGYWDMETISNSGLLQDFSKNNINGLSIGGVNFGNVSGIIGKATYFKNRNDIIQLINPGIINFYNFTGGLTISLWLYYDFLYQGNWGLNVLCNHYDWPLLTDTKTASLSTDGLKFWPRGDQVFNSVINKNNIKEYTWNHITATYDYNNAKLYLNGKLINNLALTGVMPNNINSLYIGGCSGQNNTGVVVFPFKVDELYIYNRSISDSEVLSIYNAIK